MCSPASKWALDPKVICFLSRLHTSLGGDLFIISSDSLWMEYQSRLPRRFLCLFPADTCIAFISSVMYIHSSVYILQGPRVCEVGRHEPTEQGIRGSSSSNSGLVPFKNRIWPTHRANSDNSLRFCVTSRYYQNSIQSALRLCCGDLPQTNSQTNRFLAPCWQ